MAGGEKFRSYEAAKGGGTRGQDAELATFSVAVIKHPGKRILRQDGFPLVHSSNVPRAGPGMAAGAFSSQSRGPTVRKQSVLNAIAYQRFLSPSGFCSVWPLRSLLSSVKSWEHPHRHAQRCDFMPS